MKILKLTTLLIGLFLITGCGDDDGLALISIDEYIEQNGIQNVLETSTGLKYTIDEPGSDEKPGIGAVVNVAYTGYRTDELVFDSSPGFEGALALFIAGWQEGIPLFGRGGSGTLFIPAELAYGSRGAGADIPPNADIIFDIQLLNF